MKTVKYKYSLSFIFGILLILVSIVILGYDYFKGKKIEVFEEKNIALLESEIPREIIDENDVVDDTGSTNDESSQDNNSNNVPTVQKPNLIDYTKYYVGTLEIPKINLKKGFLNVDSPYNVVDKNVTVVKTSDYPDVEKGNFILAAHTGNQSISFFTRLHDLVIGDLAYINYKQKKYTYQLVDIYTQPKIGTISIYRDIEKTTLTLVTCTKGTQKTQTIFILELIEVVQFLSIGLSTIIDEKKNW